MLLVAVSGGIDSMCLAEKVRLEGGPFAIAHCNFGLRGAESDADEAFVRSWASSHGIPLHVKQFETQAFAAAEGISIEMAARRLRYRWFGQLCREHGYEAVAVAHNANDNAETLLLNLLRGTGLRGIIGMKPSGFLPDPLYGDIPLLRPLLGMTRADIEAFAAEHGLSWRDDSTNALNDYKRNKIRNLVFPVFKEINPRFVEVLNRDMERFARELREGEAGPGAGGGPGPGHKSGPGPISGGGPGPASVPQNGLGAMVGGPGPGHKSGPGPISGGGPGPASVPQNGLGAMVGGPGPKQVVDLVQRQEQHLNQEQHLSPYPAPNPTQDPRPQDPRPQAPQPQDPRPQDPRPQDPRPQAPQPQDPQPQAFTITEESWDGSQEVKQPAGMLILDKEKAGELVEGRWETGDWIRPLGAPGKKKMQDWFTDHHIPADEKPFVPLLKSARDPHHVLAVVGYCIDHQVRVTKSTRQILRISVKNL